MTVEDMDYAQHTQYMQFLARLQSCKNQAEIDELKTQFYGIHDFSFLKDVVPERNGKTFASYKTELVYALDNAKYDYKKIYGENFRIPQAFSVTPEESAAYTVEDFLKEAAACKSVEEYKNLYDEKNKFKRMIIKQISPDDLAIYGREPYENGLPDMLVPNTPENGLRIRTRISEAGFSPFDIPAPEDAQNNGIEWLLHEVEEMKDYFNPNLAHENPSEEPEEPEPQEEFYDGSPADPAEIHEGGTQEAPDTDETSPSPALTDEDLKYIESEEFIERFGDWKKAQRLEKLKAAEPIVADGKIIIDGEDLTDEIKNLRAGQNIKVLKFLAKEIGRQITGSYENLDTHENITLSMGNISEVRNHHISSEGHLESVKLIPDLIKNGIFITKEKNEDKEKHPNITEYQYFVSGIKIDGTDYTAKSVIATDTDGNHYYDHRLSRIEKGRLIDNLSLLVSGGKPTADLTDYDKRLADICQCPQRQFLDKNLLPTRDAVEQIRAGKTLGDLLDAGADSAGQEQENGAPEYISEADVPPDVPPESASPENEDTEIITEENGSPQQETPAAASPEPEDRRPSKSDNDYRTSGYVRNFYSKAYEPGCPVPPIGMRNERTGHITEISGYEFARTVPEEDAVLLTKIVDGKRKFIKLDKTVYETAVRNAAIIAKAKDNKITPDVIQRYTEAAELDETKQRDNTAKNFWHNYQAAVMSHCNSPAEAMEWAKRLVSEMIPSEKAEFAKMIEAYEKIHDENGRNLSYDKRILDAYQDFTKGMKITDNSIWRDFSDDKNNVLDAIKSNTEVFDKEGQALDRSCDMKIGDTIRIKLTVESALGREPMTLPSTEYRLVAHSKDTNTVALISVDGKSKIIKSREEFIENVRKIEKRQRRIRRREDMSSTIAI